MNQDRLMQVLVAPHVSEKSAGLAETTSQHVFKVVPDATKSEIKKAVELMLEVEVTGVRVVNMPGKQKMFGRRPGSRKNWRKAYVTLAPGQDVDYGAE